MKSLFPALLLLTALVGCSAYKWTSNVPEDMRTVCVPTFRNETDVVELGAVATREVLRELQREGTFKLASADAAAVEIQGVLKSASAGILNFKREISMRAYEQRMTLTAEISVVDRKSGKVLVDGQRYVAETTFFSDNDVVTARRDASGRIAEDLARQVVDDLVARNWRDGEKKGKENN